MRQSSKGVRALGPPSWRPTAALGLVTALLVYVGCSSPRDEVVGPAERKVAAGPETSAPPPPSKSLFPGWPTPDAALVISGEQLGYLEPCGCTQGQLGGLPRRYEFVERLRTERKWPLALLELGSLIKDPNAARGGAEQTKVMFRTALKALGVMKYDAMALSPDDLKVGVDQASGEFLNAPEDGP
ncbi:MAG: hypothetical protein AB7I30_20870, partial [Isosphaeraceae bacterium]